MKAGVEENELGMEIISFDDPVNTVPSANLISGDYLSSSIAPTIPSNAVITHPIFVVTTKNNNRSRLSVKVLKDATTTKQPGSIIERIINSITAISTTASPDTTTKMTTTTEVEPTKASAILKLATKKTSTSKHTTKRTRTSKRTETSTTEKPTTIIEKILSSLSAIQADSQSFNDTRHQVGTDFNTITPSTSQSKLFRVTKSTTPLSTSSSFNTISFPAQTSTTENPFSVLEEISSEQTLQKRTIGKLLALLNSLTSTAKPESAELVLVTPKITTFVTGTPYENLVDSPISSKSTETTTSIPTTTVPITVASVKESTATTAVPTTTPLSVTTTNVPSTVDTTTKILTTTTPKLFTSQILATDILPTLSSRIQESFASLAKLISPTVTTPQTTDSTTSPITTSVPSTTSSTVTPTTVDTSTKIETTTVADGTTVSSTVPSTPKTTASANILTLLSVTTSIPNTTDVQRATVVATTEPSSNLIASTTPTPETTTDNAQFVTSTLPTLANFEVSPGSVRVFSANDLVDIFDPNDIDIFGTAVSIFSRGGSDFTTTAPGTSTNTSTASMTTVRTDATSVSNSSNEVSTSTTESSTVEATTRDISSNIIDTTGAVTAKQQAPLNQTSDNTQTNTNVTIESRSGKLLNIEQDPVSNDIQNSSVTPTKDYFVFAVLNNNTILRKRPSTYPTKETPFLIYGLYPNNSVVQKFPNGTQVPMEPIIRVNGFDTRANPPPLPEITSNQVTTTPGGQRENKSLQTVLIINNFWWLVLSQLPSYIYITLMCHFLQISFFLFSFTYLCSSIAVFVAFTTNFIQDKSVYSCQDKTHKIKYLLNLSNDIYAYLLCKYFIYRMLLNINNRH